MRRRRILSRRDATRRCGNLFQDERGFTTVSMVLSLLITLSLVFTAAQVYRINSLSAEVQDVADAAALSAENQVAEFMTVARFCDAVVLSLTLSGFASLVLGVAALCTPVTAPLSEGLIEIGTQLVKTRDAFADRAARALNRLQEALPFFAAACAAGVSASNNTASAESFYLGVAVPLPLKGERLETLEDEKTQGVIDDINEQKDEIKERAKEAEDAAQEADAAKSRAFMRDCGDSPSYCMHERAAHLANLSGSTNPLYSSVDAWSFSVALERARSYYQVRLGSEAPANSSPDEQARSALRSRFYRFAVDEMKRAYVIETDDLFDACFPHLPKNTADMRKTRLYTEAVYPITTDESGESVMHAWAGCPNVRGRSTPGSIREMEEGEFETCDLCRFTAASMGKVAAASTTIENGFEYHYEAVASEAERYEDARRRADAPKAEVKEKAGNLIDQLKEAVEETAGKRIKPTPPGSYGFIAFVVNAKTSSAAGAFASRFVSTEGTLGPRAAISASTLVDEGTEEGRTVLNSLLDGLRERGGAAVGAAGIVLDAWSCLLGAYADRTDAVVQAIVNGLDAMPLFGSSGLGTWAKKKLSDAASALQLEPADLSALKPVLINSSYVAEKGQSPAASGLIAVKQHILAHPLFSTDLFTGILTDAEREALDQIDGMGDSIEIASIELLGEGGPSIPVTIPLPDAVKQFGADSLQGLFDVLRAEHARTAEVRPWE